MKTFYAPLKNQKQLYMKNPLNGEDIVINREELLRKTFVSPFQHSVRDNTNYYFKYSKELEPYLDNSSSPQKTYNRRLKVKNSYLTIFPMYGLTQTKKMFVPNSKISIGTELEKADRINYEHYHKMDHINFY